MLTRLALVNGPEESSPCQDSVAIPAGPLCNAENLRILERFLPPRQYIFFQPPAHEHLAAMSQEMTRKKKRTLDKWRGQLRSDTVSKYRVENGTVPGSTCEGHKYSPPTYGRNKLARASSEEKSALSHKLSIKNVAPPDCCRLRIRSRFEKRKK